MGLNQVLLRPPLETQFRIKPSQDPFLSTLFIQIFFFILRIILNRLADLQYPQTHVVDCITNKSSISLNKVSQTHFGATFITNSSFSTAYGTLLLDSLFWNSLSLPLLKDCFLLWYSLQCLMNQFFYLKKKILVCSLWNSGAKYVGNKMLRQLQNFSETFVYHVRNGFVMPQHFTKDYDLVL